MNDLHALTENLAALLRRAHDALADFLVALADFDRKRQWAGLGYGSLFSFLHRELRLSKGAAQYRKVAAELIQQVPAVVEPLRAGKLCLTSVIEAAKVVTVENWETVLPRFYGLSKREAMELVAALHPQAAPPVRTVFTAAGPCASHTAAAPAPLAGREPEATKASDLPAMAGRPDEPPPAPRSAAPPPRPTELLPLSSEASRLHVTVSTRFARKLEELRDARPDATDEELLEAGLDLLLAQVAKRRGLVEKPQKEPRPSKKPEHIPAHVRREVWKRDGGRCQWPTSSGVCGCTRRLQLDHVVPLALGGTSTADNVRILCASHNLEAARLALGNEWMARFAPRRLLRASPPPTPSPGAALRGSSP